MSFVYTGPIAAADVIIELADRPGHIVLIERANPPLGFAIPGGFIDADESSEQAAVREASEEVGLDVELSVLLGVYSRPGRDPRRHTLSVVYIGRAPGTPQAGDDAAAAHVFSVHALPDELAFDHAEVLADYLAYRASGRLQGPKHG